MPFVEIAGYRIRYREQGRGRPALVLVHGAGASSLCWSELVNLLGRHRHTVALDLPGHGQSTPTGAPWSLHDRGLLDRYRDVVAELSERLGLGRFVLAGHSMGGAVAQRFALAYPDRLAALVLIATGARLRVGPQVFDVLERRFDRFVAFLAASAFSPATARARAERWAALQVRAPRPVVIADFHACDRFDVRAELSQLSSGREPQFATTIIGGRDDQLTPPSLQRELAALLPRARLELLGRAGHQLFLERPPEVLRLLLAAGSTTAHDLARANVGPVV